MAKAATKADSSDVPGVTGRTQWDALVDVLRLLGNAGPYLILVGLVVFGFYKFQEQSQQREIDLQKVRETATESYRQQLSAANKALVDTYQAMGNISGTQIKNVSDMLELHAKATARTQEMQRAQEQQLSKLNQAQHEVETASDQKKRAESELKGVQDSVARDRAELERLETALKEGKRNLSDSAVQVGAVRGKMVELATAVRNNSSVAASKLAAEILKENADPIDIKPDGLDSSALKSLIGRGDAETVADLVKSAEFVIRKGGTRSDDKSSASRIFAGKAPAGAFFKDVTQLESDGSRIVSTDVASIFATVTSDEDDWYSLRKHLVVHSDHSTTGSTLPNDKDTWGLDDVPDNEVIKNYPGKLPFLDLDQLRKEAPAIFDWYKSSPFGELQNGMFERAKGFKAVSLLPMTNVGDLASIPSDLRDTAVRLFDAAVKRQLNELTNLIANSPSFPALPGQVAATVLHPDFEFTRYVRPSPDSGGSVISASLIGRYDYRGHGFRKYGFARERIATFTFTRRGEAGWQLDQLATAPKEPLRP
jgi:predicted  nucleic acid-binding Zn-ribbon protein